MYRQCVLWFCRLHCVCVCLTNNNFTAAQPRAGLYIFTRLYVYVVHCVVDSQLLGLLQLLYVADVCSVVCLNACACLYRDVPSVACFRHQVSLLWCCWGCRSWFHVTVATVCEMLNKLDFVLCSFRQMKCVLSP